MSYAFSSHQLLRSRGLSSMLLTAMVVAALVVADLVIESHSDGHLLVAWIALWAVAFTSLAMFAGTASKLAESLAIPITRWKNIQSRRAADADYLALAQRNPRIMAELLAAVERAQAARSAIDLAHGRAWVDHRPRGTLNAAYAGPRNGYLTTPLTGLPSHLQLLPR